MTNKEKIIIYYYEDKLNTIIISKKLNVSKQYVSRIIRTDLRYLEEKQKRKLLNKIERNRKKAIWNKNKREKLRAARLDGVLEMLHNQASYELSGKHTINNRTFKKWNASIYEYYGKKKEFRIKSEIKVNISYAVPKRIKWN